MKKLVFESMNDFLRFTQDGDPIDDMNIGSKPLIYEWLKKYNIINRCALRKDKTIDCVGTINLSGILEENKFPEYIKFNVVHGGFHCDDNSLISLEGCPNIVTGSFVCRNNKLKNLIGGPKSVKEGYSASNNKLTSLEGIPEIIEGSLWLSGNELKSLKYCPYVINGDLNIQLNPIETLDYFPKKIKGNFYFTTDDNIMTKENIINKFNDRINGQLFYH